MNQEQLLQKSQCASLPQLGVSHPGVCPNHLNPNLWVDAQSTCDRECNIDKDCEGFEKCCTNVCGLKSCVAARFADGSFSQLDVSREKTCENFVCTQQGSDCDIWDGQPICKCKDRCEKEPNFTCASDGLTYYNKCYMDAEACIRGIALTVVTCRYHFTWPNTSPIPLETTAHTTPISSLEESVPPALYTNPFHQSVYIGGTVSFHCDVSGRPRPDIIWEKQSDHQENLIMRPDQMYGNVVVTNIGQLVIYNAQPEDAGIYTCTARNSAGLLRADYPLSIIKREHLEDSKPESPKLLSPGECLKEPDKGDCETHRIRWYYDHRKGTCLTFRYGGCDGSKNHFETYEECKETCMTESVNMCTLPAVQGPCKNWEPRWAYNSLIKQCHAFIYGGCEGNENNFDTKVACEETCPFPKHQHCKACKPKSKIIPSFCKSDFAIIGRLTEIIEDQDSGIARIALDEVLKDEKMGLKFFNSKHLEVTLMGIDWNCPCPNITTEEGPLIIMGEVYDGMAVLDPDSYVRALNDKRIKKIHEIVEKKTCELLHRFQD
ncbi:WAP, Kazal, immunoglobulin, Kunitz and NTR domain-containing protein 1 [Latimeria chalumnae]|uniref:WAP, Kazal, immunoglobulin, Kunitz and NTR domain-containing protein 1 n=1 Tax=Latimeria chalumnae TaxID=7897 RepID=UPI0006D918CB|nr:PREDICTED: WAP, Kazal, immunoglobulin, Kunitz and NTR domain-containing protein 1 [Latimeria chalumnae]|eukprot:XP_005990745.2 PREDICTED: WAP, Kazal, immunoglobulin, Kunitz and NTR domain-containing protein 1 [Latimeria chalumnae]